MDNVTEYEYDYLGRRKKTILPDPDGTGPLAAPEHEMAYDRLGRVTTQTDPFDNVTIYEYDSAGRLTKVTLPDPDGGGPLVAPEIETLFNDAGRVWKRIDPLDNVTEYQYDDLGRQWKTISPDPDGGGPLAAPETETLYTDLGQVWKQIDPLGNVTEYQYDNLGRLKKTIDAELGETTFAYDAAGRRTSLTDPEENTTAWVYDNLGRVIEETNELSDTRYFHYDAAGRMIRQVDRRGWVRDFEFDALSRNTFEYWYDDETAADADTTRTAAENTFAFTFAAAGQLLTARDDAADYEYAYDNLGRATSVEHTIAGLTPLVTFTHHFDAASQRTRLAADVGGTDDFVTDYVYDHLGRVDTIKQQDQAGGNSVADKYVDFLFDAASQFDEIDRYADLAGTGLVAHTDYVFDNLGRLTDLTHLENQTTFADYDLVYDVAGRITDFDFDSLVGDNGNADYTHDDTNQLTDADYDADWQADEGYVYDDNGNRETANGHTYATGDNNRLTSDGTYAYLYDAEGNRTHRFIDADASGTITTGDTAITEYTWDHRNRLTAVTDYDDYDDYNSETPSQIVEYAYDFANRWVRKVLDSDGNGTADSSTIFVYDGSQIALQFDKTGTDDAAAADLSHRYLYGPSVDQILVDEEVSSLGAAGTRHWPLSDHLGSVRDVIDDSGTVELHRVYDAFGNMGTPDPANYAHLFAYTGRPLDEDTGLQNNLHRWYDAMVAKWLSEDPIGFRAGDANLLRYVRNAPLSWTDAFGLLTKSYHWKLTSTLAVNSFADSLAYKKPFDITVSHYQVALRFSWGFEVKFAGCLTREGNYVFTSLPEIEKEFAKVVLYKQRLGGELGDEVPGLASFYKVEEHAQRIRDRVIEKLKSGKTVEFSTIGMTASFFPATSKLLDKVQELTDKQIDDLVDKYMKGASGILPGGSLAAFILNQVKAADKLKAGAKDIYKGILKRFSKYDIDLNSAIRAFADVKMQYDVYSDGGAVGWRVEHGSFAKEFGNKMMGVITPWQNHIGELSKTVIAEETWKDFWDP